MGVEVSPVNCCDAAARERAIAAFADSSNGGLIVTGSQFGANHPDVFVALAARYKLPWKEESAKSRILILRGVRSNRDQAQAAVTPASQPIRTSVIMINGFLPRLPF